MEACTTSLGNLLEDRMESNLGPLESSKIITVGTDISEALKYLHNDVMLMHGDMKSYNILIKGDFEISKLCDFGVSVPITDDGLLDFEKNPNVEYTGTELWNAPELFEEDSSLVSVKSEIFSFGLVIYECIALCPPHTLKVTTQKALDFDNLNDENEEENIEDEEDEYEDEMDFMVGTRPLFPQDLKLTTDYNPILEVFFLCTDDDPDKRPSSNQLSDIFAEIKNNV
jgi:PDZ-binding kinase